MLGNPTDYYLALETAHSSHHKQRQSSVHKWQVLLYDDCKGGRCVFTAALHATLCTIGNAAPQNPDWIHFRKEVHDTYSAPRLLYGRPPKA